MPLQWVINVGVIAQEERYLERKFGGGVSGVQGAAAAVGLMASLGLM